MLYLGGYFSKFALRHLLKVEWKIYLSSIIYLAFPVLVRRNIIKHICPCYLSRYILHRVAHVRSCSSQMWESAVESTVGPPYPWVLYPRIQPSVKNKLKKKSRKFQKAKLYLHSLYVVLGIISNLEMI